MIVKLARYTFPDDPNWEVMKSHIPLGTEYEVLGFVARMDMLDLDRGRLRFEDCYLVRRVDKTDIMPGFVPVVVFEV